MTRQFIADTVPGQRTDSQTFLVAAKDLRTTTQGSLYIHCILADRTGQMVARVWSATEEMFHTIPTGGFINVRGRAESYKGNLQFIIEAIRPVDPKTVELSDFLPATDLDIEALWSRTRAILDEISDPHLSAILAEFLKDEDRIHQLKTAPAAMSMHHAYLGGLLEHTLSVLELAKVVIPRYPHVKLDLVLAGVFLHDLGKTAELGFTTHFHYSDQGQLLGHISICVSWIEQMAAQAARTLGRPFPERIKWALQHIVLTHHARPEFGSPKLPAIPEAFAVHYLDNLDAKLNMCRSAVDSDRDPSSRWTPFHRGLETKIYKPDILTCQE